jgi:hypothetical protein
VIEIFFSEQDILEVALASWVIWLF